MTQQRAEPITNYSNTIVALRDVERSSGSFMERSIVRGLFLGIFLGPVVDAIRKQKKATEQVLAEAIARLNLSANDVDRVLREHELQLPKSAGAYARLKKRKVL